VASYTPLPNFSLLLTEKQAARGSAILDAFEKKRVFASLEIERQLLGRTVYCLIDILSTHYPVSKLS